MRLHERVRAFARAHQRGRVVAQSGEDSFEQLALDIARYQLAQGAGFARLATHAAGELKQLSDIPPVTTDAFRFGRVAVHPPELDAAVFVTSGTTALPGTHAVRDLTTKEQLAQQQAEGALFEKHGRGIVIALADCPTDPPTSSLTHMMQLLMQAFDGRALSTEPEGSAFDLRSPARWLSGKTGVDIEGLQRACRLAIHRSEPLYVLTTSFALLAAIEALDGQKVRTSSRTTIMLTGGFKGVRTSVDESELREMTARAFGLTNEDIVGEYGMTELSSQLFEGPPGHYVAPPWLRVQAVDPCTFAPVADGEEGLARFFDLANVDSSVSVLTRDVVRITEQGVQLLGRSKRATPRGCSLPYEGLIATKATTKPTKVTTSSNGTTRPTGRQS